MSVNGAIEDTWIQSVRDFCCRHFAFRRLSVTTTCQICADTDKTKTGHVMIPNLYRTLSPARRQAITLTKCWLIVGSTITWTKFSAIWIKMRRFSLKNLHLKMLSAKWQPFCFGSNLLHEEYTCERLLPRLPLKCIVYETPNRTSISDQKIIFWYQKNAENQSSDIRKWPRFFSYKKFMYFLISEIRFSDKFSHQVFLLYIVCIVSGI